MRTTLTLDEDVATALERLRRARNARFRDVVNDALRRGLAELTKNKREPFRTQSAALERLRLASIDNIGEGLAAAEGKSFK